VQSNADCAAGLGAAALGFAAAVCDGTIKTGDLQLIWDESDKAVTGYKVYQVDRVGAGSHTLLGAATGTTRYYLVKKPSGGYANMCFAVQAYVGSRASTDSSHYCYAPGATATTLTLKPSHTVTYVNLQWNDIRCSTSEIFKAANRDFGSAFTTFFPWLLNENGGGGSGRRTVDSVYVGNETVVWKNQRSCKNGNPIQDAGIQAFANVSFDLDLKTLAKHKLYSATLTLEPVQTVVLASGKVTLSRGNWCQTFIGITENGNPTIPSAFNAPPYGPTVVPHGPARGAASINVTGIVYAWVKGVPYGKGFGVGTGHPLEYSLQGFFFPTASFVCLTKFSTPSLQVVYF